MGCTTRAPSHHHSRYLTVPVRFQVLNKYTALYAAYVLQNGMPEDALQLFVKHGAPPTSNNLNLYRRLVVDLLSEPSPKLYRVWADLREVLLRCVAILAMVG